MTKPHKPSILHTATTSGVGVGLNAHRESASASRQSLLGKNAGKAVVIRCPTPRRIISGDELDYGDTARKIELTTRARVEEIFYVKDPLHLEAEPWGSYYVIFQSFENGEYFLLEMPKYHRQNTDIGFEYKYRKEAMRLLERDAVINAGTVFATSSRISENGEWCLGIQTNQVALTHYDSEEDGNVISESFAHKVGVVFERSHTKGWNEDEWTLLNLYGTLDDHQPFPLPGQKVRDDGILFGLRRKNMDNALAAQTKHALMIPNDTYDMLVYEKRGSTVVDVIVATDRYKNQANNKKAYKRTQPHTRHLESIESVYNDFYNKIVNWYNKKKQALPTGQLVPMSDELWGLVVKASGNITVNFSSNGQYRQYNMVKRKLQNITYKDWQLTIKVRQEVDAQVRFKMTGMHGNKVTIGKIKPDHEMPVDDYGVRADVINSNVPDCKRQIFSSPLEYDINFINTRVGVKVKSLVEAGDFDTAWKEVQYFYETVSPLTKELSDHLTEEERLEMLRDIARDPNELAIYPDPDIRGVEITQRIVERYPDMKPTPVTWINAYGVKIRTHSPVIMSSVYNLMLDKFGSDISSQSTGRFNVFGIPSSLSKEDKYSNFYRAQLTRIVGITEGRLLINQYGGTQAVLHVLLGNSPEAVNLAVKRIIRSDNPFNIERLVHPGEEKTNHSLALIESVLSDYGFVLRKENEDDII